MTRILLLLPFLFLFGCISEDEHNAVLQQNSELQIELQEQKNLVYELEDENRSLKADVAVAEMLLKQCEDRINGDAFVLTLSGRRGYVRLEGYEEAVEYLKDCCY